MYSGREQPAQILSPSFGRRFSIAKSFVDMGRIRPFPPFCGWILKDEAPVTTY